MFQNILEFKANCFHLSEKWLLISLSCIPGTKWTSSRVVLKTFTCMFPTLWGSPFTWLYFYIFSSQVWYKLICGLVGFELLLVCHTMHFVFSCSCCWAEMCGLIITTCYLLAVLYSILHYMYILCMSFNCRFALLNCGTLPTGKDFLMYIIVHLQIWHLALIPCQKVGETMHSRPLGQ